MITPWVDTRLRSEGGSVVGIRRVGTYVYLAGDKQKYM